MTRKNCLLMLTGAFAAPAFAGTPPGPIPPLEKWKAGPVPRENTKAWQEANYSRLEWQVFLQNGKVQVRPYDARKPDLIRLPFRLAMRVVGSDPKIAGAGTEGTNLYSRHDALKVSNGWLLWSNDGEWGGCINWFAPDGTKQYKISDDQIVAYAQTPAGRFAVQGLAHMGIRRGTLLKLNQDGQGKWEAQTIVDLHDAPYAFLPEQDGTFLVVTSTKILRVGTTPPAVNTLYEKAFWWGMYSNSMVKAPSGDLFIGMRGGVVRAVKAGDSYRLEWLPSPITGEKYL